MQRRFDFPHGLCSGHMQRTARRLRVAAAAEPTGRLIHPVGRQRPKAGLHRVFPLLMQIIGHANALNVDGVIHYAVCFRRIQTVLTELLSSEFKSIPSTLLFYKTNYILFYKPVNELKQKSDFSTD